MSRYRIVKRTNGLGEVWWVTQFAMKELFWHHWVDFDLTFYSEEDAQKFVMEQKRKDSVSEEVVPLVEYITEEVVHKE